MRMLKSLQNDFITNAHIASHDPAMSPIHILNITGPKG